MDLAGSTAVVTGAASGIGRASALAMAAQGANVVVGDVDEEGGRQTVEAISGAGGTATFVGCDVTRVEDLRATFDAAAAAYGSLDVVHNNAGIVCGEPHFPDTAPEVLLRQVMVNLGGVVIGTRIAVDHMAGRGGAVVNTASIGSLLPLAEEPAYSATKAGVLMFTRACAGLHATHKVRVNTVLPGLVETSLLAKSGDGIHEAPWVTVARQLLPVIDVDDVVAAVIEFIHDDGAAGQHRIVGDLPAEVADMLHL
jgi:NAD(P)-dependent dehydrogenase (short-subunit alcohol dehydrogenase family)